MTKAKTIALAAAAAVLAITAAWTGATVAVSPAKASALTTAPAQTQSRYKKATWDNYQKQLAAPSRGTNPEIPPTDCPPLPSEECLKTWR